MGRHGSKNYTDEEFAEQLALCDSVADLLRRLGLVAAGGNYLQVKQNCERLGLDYPANAKIGLQRPYGTPYSGRQRRNVDDYLKYEYCSTNHLKKKLFEAGYKVPICEICGLEDWLDQPIALELDHIDGDRKNNFLENLRVICPNCHAQTDTYRGKNIGVRFVDGVPNISREEKIAERKALYRIKLERNTLKKYCECGAEISLRSKTCEECYYESRRGVLMPHKFKIDWPGDQELLERLANSNYTKLAKELGCTDNAIRRHMKYRNLKL